MNHWNTKSESFAASGFVVILLVAVVLVVAIVLSFAEVSNLLVANKDNFLKYEYNNEVSSHQEVLYTFCFYPGAHTTAVTGLLTVKCRIRAAVSFSVTMQVAASLLEQAINMFYNYNPTIHSTYTTVMMENHNG